MKKVFRAIIFFLMAICMAGFVGITTCRAEEKSVNEQILDILLDKGEIPHWRYNELQAQAKKKDKATAWLKGFKFKGDLRLRYEGKYNQSGYDDDRHRGRYRLRVGFEKKMSSDLKVIARFASGKGEPTSTNQSFDDAFESKDFWIDRAYAVYKPNFLSGLELGGGKFKNPFVHTDMVWDSDVNPEGIYEKYTCSLGKSFKPFITLGQMVIEENKGEKDACLIAWQGGFQALTSHGVKWTLALTYYDFMNLDKSKLGEKYSGGNTVIDDKLVYEYRLLNFTNFIEFKIGRLPMKIFFDYVNNQDNDVEKDEGYAAGFKLGKTKKKGSWAFSYKYASIEPDAVVGAFCDSDFGHANREGSKAGFAYQLMDKVTLKLTGYFIEEKSGKENEYNMVHADVIFKF